MMTWVLRTAGCGKGRWDPIVSWRWMHADERRCRLMYGATRARDVDERVEHWRITKPIA